MTAYAIVDVDIYDVADYLLYQNAVRPLLAGVGARYLARGGEFQVLEGYMEPQRLIIIEFPSMDVLTDFYSSDAYKALEAQRNSCSRYTLVAVRGIDDDAPQAQG